MYLLFPAHILNCDHQSTQCIQTAYNNMHFLKSENRLGSRDAYQKHSNYQTHKS